MSDALREALAAAGVGALIAKEIDENLLEYERRYSPLVRTIPTVPWDTNVYFWNTRTARPSGGFVQDGGARPVATSTYVQNQFTIRNLQSVGAVTGFAQAVTRGVIGDLKQREIDGAIQSLIWDIENAIVTGFEAATYNATSGALGPYPQYTGLSFQVNSFSGQTQNSVDEAGATLTLAMLNKLRNIVESNAAMPVQGPEYMYVLSPGAHVGLDSLFTNQQRFLGEVEVAAGLIVNSYAGIPLIKSSMLAPGGLQLGTVTAGTTQGGTGVLGAGTFRYQVSAVMQRFGEIAASVEVDQVVGSGAAGNTQLAVTTPSGPEGAQPLLYLVYRSTLGGAVGTISLLGVVDAYDTTGAAVTSIIDTGAALQTNSAANSVNPTAYVGGNAGLGPRGINQEDIYLVPRSEDFLLRPVVRDITPITLAATIAAPDTLPFALVTDTCLATRAPKYMARLARVVAGA